MSRAKHRARRAQETAIGHAAVQAVLCWPAAGGATVQDTIAQALHALEAQGTPVAIQGWNVTPRPDGNGYGVTLHYLEAGRPVCLRYAVTRDPVALVALDDWTRRLSGL